MARPVIGPHSGPKDALLTYARQHGGQRLDQAEQLINELFAQTTMDGFMIAIQVIHETDVFHSPIWKTRLNPAGLGVTDGPDDGISFSNGRDAARAILVHHAAYTGILPAAWNAWLSLDPRYTIAKKEFGGSVRTWADYGHGRWASDPQYYAGILKHEAAVRALAPTQEDTIMPTIIDKWLHEAQDGYAAVNRRIVGRYGMSPKIIVIHIQEGNNWGSWQHFHTVSASATVLIGKNGDIWRLVPESDGPWTNGDVKSPTAKGWDIINKWGADPNAYSLTIETEGFTGEWPKPQAQLDSVVWQVKQWMAKYNIPVEYVVKHGDINSVDRRYCPGDAFYNYVINAVKSSAPATNAPVYGAAQPVVIDGKKWDGKHNGKMGDVFFTADTRKVTAAKDGVEAHTFASKTSAFTRKPLRKGDVFSVLGWVNGQKIGDENRWWITKNYSRIFVGDTVEKPSAQEVDSPSDLPEGVVEYKGIVYYPVSGEERKQRVVQNANLREAASTKSKVIGTVKKGDEVTAAYWCFGTEVKNENIWWVLKDNVKNPIREGARLFVAATAARPD